MADTRDEWRAERGGERAARGPVAGWLDDRGVSEVIGSILVFGLLVSLLAIVQTQAVPNANQEVEVKHSGDVQGDMANLQAAITRTSAFGGTESTVVETGMTYPPRLVLYNPPAVQGTLRTTSGPTPNARIANFTASGGQLNLARYIVSNPTYSTNLVEYSADYNRYEDSPTIRYEHSALVSDYGDNSTVEATGSIVNGRRISLTFLGDGLEQSQVRPSSVTTYPVSAPAQVVEIETRSFRGNITLPTNINESVWVRDILSDQIDTNALPSGGATACNDLDAINSSNPAAPDDGRYIVDCQYIPANSSGQPNSLMLKLQTNATYELQMSKVGFRAGTDRPPARYLTSREAISEADEVTLELRDRYNNPVAGSELAQAPVLSNGSLGAIEETYRSGSDGQVELEKPEDTKAYYLNDSRKALTPVNASTCLSSAGCVLSTQLTSPAEPVRLSDARITANDNVTFTLQNFGPERTIDTVKVNYITVHEQKTVVDNASIGTTLGDTIGAIAGTSISLGKTNATDTIDGPNALTDIEVEPNNGTSASEEFDPDPVENGPAVTAPGLTAIPANSNANNLTLTFDESIEADMQNDFGNSETPKDMLEVSVTVTYSDGYRTTYTTQLHHPEDDAR